MNADEYKMSCPECNGYGYYGDGYSTYTITDGVAKVDEVKPTTCQCCQGKGYLTVREVQE